MLRAIKAFPIAVSGNFLDVEVGDFVFRLISTTSLLRKVESFVKAEAGFLTDGKRRKKREAITIYVSPVIGREESFVLYGFSTSEEKESFDILLTITGIGPKLAFRIVEFFGPSVMDVLRSAPHRIAEVPRIGSKKAKSFLPAIEDKFGAEKQVSGLTLEQRKKKNSILQALRNLGFSKDEALNLLDGIDMNAPERDILVEALKKAGSV